MVVGASAGGGDRGRVVDTEEAAGWWGCSGVAGASGMGDGLGGVEGICQDEVEAVRQGVASDDCGWERSISHLISIAVKSVQCGAASTSPSPN